MRTAKVESVNERVGPDFVVLTLYRPSGTSVRPKKEPKKTKKPSTLNAQLIC